VFCCFVIIRVHAEFAHPLAGLLAAAAIVAVTLAVTMLALTGQAHRPVVVGLDLLVTVLLTLATLYVQTAAQVHQVDGGLVTLTSVWAAGPVIEAGLLGGWPAGVAAGLVQSIASIAVRGDWADGHTLTNAVLLLLVGGLAGYIATLTTRAEAELAEAAARQAGVAERERLSRSVHDGVLQVLGLVHRRAATAGADWQELGHAVAAEEISLRSLITSGPAPSPTGPGPARSGPESPDLVAELVGLRSSLVTVSGPATPVLLPDHAVREVAAAVRACLHNVATHAGAGARAWVLVEDLGGSVVITVRDDGIGFAPGRLDAAAGDGRIGVARSIRGRVADLGGDVRISSAPGSGTEVVLVVHRSGPGARR
jgi:signal transduction histidine kinase